MFESLDYVYVPTTDVDDAARRYVADFGAELVWKVRGMGTVVACLRLSAAGPQLLLSGHLEGENPILVYRVRSHASTVEELRSAGTEVRELEIPQGPCASFRGPGGQRLAVYELVRPDATEFFAGRFDD